MRKLFILATFAAFGAAGCGSVSMNSASMKTLQALSISDEQIEQYVGEYIRQLDSENTIASVNDPYTLRLNRIAGPINNRDRINIKVYKTKDVNALFLLTSNLVNRL